MGDGRHGSSGRAQSRLFPLPRQQVGKSHIYKEISPHSILVSGGQTTVANRFYNMARRQVGLVGLWDVVAFDEVAGISFKDKDGVQIMKDYMASGSFARGRDPVNAYASMVFIGNIDRVDTLVKKEAVRRCLEYALEARRRVKEQLKKIGGMEFFDVHFSYIDVQTMEEKFISLPEQGGRSLIPDGPLNPGVMHTIATGLSGHLGLYRLETQVTSGNGGLRTSGLGSNASAREAIKVGYDYYKANASRVSASIKAGDHDYHLHIVELHNTGPTTAMTLAAFRAPARAPVQMPLVQRSLVSPISPL